MYRTCIEHMKYITRVSHFTTTFIRVFYRPHKHVAKFDNEMHISMCITIDHCCCQILTIAVVFQKIQVPLSHTKFHEILSTIFELWHAHSHKDVQYKGDSVAGMRSHLNCGDMNKRREETVN